MITDKIMIRLQTHHGRKVENFLNRGETSRNNINLYY